MTIMRDVDYKVTEVEILDTLPEDINFWQKLETMILQNLGKVICITLEDEQNARRLYQRLIKSENKQVKPFIKQIMKRETKLYIQLIEFSREERLKWMRSIVIWS